MRYRHAGKQIALLIVKGMLSASLLFTSAMAQTSSTEELHSRLIIKWKAQPSRSHTQILEATSTHLRNIMGVGMLQRRGISNYMDGMQLQTPLNRKDFAKALAQLNADPNVEFAVEDKRRHIMALPDDQYFTAGSNRTGQWYLNDPAANSQWVSAINAISAWNYSTGGGAANGIIIADVDTGVIFDHPDLLSVASGGKLLPGYDFVDCDQSTCTGSGLTFLAANDGDGWDNDPSDPGDWVSNQDKTNNPAVFDSSCAVENSSWHGTRVSGILGALTNNTIGIAGTGYNARILPVRALGKCGGYDSDIIAGMKWAAGMAVPGVPVNPNPAKIINLSLGSAGSCGVYQDVVNSIRALGITIVASAGNDSAATNAPANCTGVIGVVALRNTGTKVGFSSLGPEISISAPGGNCVNSSGACLFSIDTTTNLGTTSPGTNDYTDELNPNLGTSFSAPIVSGTIALMLGANPSLTPSVIISRLKATATAFPQTETNTCTAPGTAPISPSAINAGPCNCTTSLCGAGMVNALAAVQSVVPPTITIHGNATTTSGGTDMLDASASTAADGGMLTYAWAILSGGGTLSSTSSSTTMVTAPSANETLVVRLTVSETQQPDNWINSVSQNFSITVGTGSNSSSSASSMSSTSSSMSSSSAASSASSAVATSSASTTISGASKGGGSFDWTWLFSLAALFALRTRLNTTTLKSSSRYF